MVVPLGPGKFYGTSLPRPRIYNDVKFNEERVDPPVKVLDPLLAWANEAHWSMGGLSFKRLRLQGRIEGSITKLRAEREKLAKKNRKLGAGSSSNGSNLSESKGKNATKDEDEDDDVVDDSPPPAPIVTKRRRFMDLIYEDEEIGRGSADEEDGKREEEIASRRVRRRRLVKKLGDDFDRVAPENEKSNKSPSKGSSDGGTRSVGSRTRRQILEDNDGCDGADAVETAIKVVQEVNKLNSKGKKQKGSGNKGKIGGGSESAPASRVRTSPRLAAKRE